MNLNLLKRKYFCSIDIIQEKELRSAPAKPKSLVPPTAKLGTNSQKLKKQGGSAERTPTPTQQAHIKKIKSQNSDEEKEKRKEIQLQRQILFDELEEVQERLEIFKADAKAETISVQGAKKFDKIVNFNKQLRQFKKVHDRNKIICQESLGENSQEEENFIPELPQPKELSSRYIKFENPKLVRRRSEQALLEFQEKHKKLAESFCRSRNISNTSDGRQSSQQPQQSKSSAKIEKVEDAIFKDIESLNNEAKAIPITEEDNNFQATQPQQLNNINLLSTTIDETFENILDNLPSNDTKTASKPTKVNIRQMIMKFEAPEPDSDTQQRSDTDSEGKQENSGHKNGKDSFLSSKFLDVFTKTTPIFSSIDETWSPTNSMSQEVINFQEQLLNFEADSLNPPDDGTKRMSHSNTKAMRRLSFEEMEADNFEKERNKLKEKNDKRSTETTLIQKGFNFLSSRVSDDKEGEKHWDVQLSKHQNVSSSSAAVAKSQKTGNDICEKLNGSAASPPISPPVNHVKDLKPAGQNGYLINSTGRADEVKETGHEKKPSAKFSLTSGIKQRFLSSFSFEKSPPETLESSIFGSSAISSESYQEKEKSPRKKAVHFEGDEKKKKKEVEISPVGSYFPIIGSILSAGPSRQAVSDISPENKVPSVTLNLPCPGSGSVSGSRKESLESIETVDTVDLELIKLGMHRSSGAGFVVRELTGPAAPSSLSSVTGPVSASEAQSSEESPASHYMSLLKNEEKITEQNSLLANKSLAQKSNFDVSKSLNVLTTSASQAEEGEKRAGAPLPTLGGPRARPGARPILVMPGGYLAHPGSVRGPRSPRLRFPPGFSGPAQARLMFRSPSPTHGLIRITPRHLPPSYRGPAPPAQGSPSPPFRHGGPRLSPGPPRPPLPPGFPAAALRSVLDCLVFLASPG